MRKLPLIVTRRGRCAGPREVQSLFYGAVAAGAVAAGAVITVPWLQCCFTALFMALWPQVPWLQWWRDGRTSSDKTAHFIPLLLNRHRRFCPRSCPCRLRRSSLQGLGHLKL